MLFFLFLLLFSKYKKKLKSKHIWKVKFPLVLKYYKKKEKKQAEE